MFSENIKRIREEKGFGVNELSRLSGVNASYISALERGEKENPTIVTLTKLADALGVPLDYLTRKSTKAIIEDRLEELNITFNDLSNETKIPITFLKNLDNIVPDEGDYRQVQKIAHALNIQPSDLLNSLARQEPPFNWSKFDKNSDQLKEECVLYTTGEFKTAEAAMKFILKQPSIMGFGGFNTNQMTDDEIVEFANELLNQMKLISYKYKK